MIYKNLYIIGNGFDIYHGIPCGFLNFKDWVKEHDAVLYFRLLKVYKYVWDDDWWSAFETSLGKLNISYYANEIGNLYDPEYVKDGTIEERTKCASIKVTEEFTKIRDALRTDFQQWLIEAYRKCNIDRIIQLFDESRFLSFNYTKTLEDVYGINSKQICHIHGIIDDKDSMIVGHGLGLEEFNDVLDCQKLRVEAEIFYKGFKTELQYVTPPHKELTEQSTIYSLSALQKNVKGCMQKNEKFFNDILDVQRIYAYGFSFSPIDMPYIEKIIRRTKPETHWVISYYSQEDKRRIMDFIVHYNIPNFTMINGIKANIL